MHVGERQAEGGVTRGFFSRESTPRYFLEGGVRTKSDRNRMCLFFLVGKGASHIRITGLPGSGRPLWLPTTYDMTCELAVFVGSQWPS